MPDCLFRFAFKGAPEGCDGSMAAVPKFDPMMFEGEIMTAAGTPEEEFWASKAAFSFT